MHRLRLTTALALAFSLALLSLRAADTPAASAPVAPAPAAAPAPSPAAADLQALVARITAKLQSGARTAAALADDLPAFDTLLAKYRDQKTDDVAQILFMQAALYAQVLDEPARARELFVRLKSDFPATKPGAEADRYLAALDQAIAAAQAETKLIGAPAPELTFNWSSRAGLKKLSDLRGKVVVLDFWATWCGPCVSSFPQVRELTAHYRDADVVVLGVTSLQGRVHGLEPKPIDTRSQPDRELALMTDYMKAKDITWPVVFSEQPVFNPAYGINGIPHMVILAPDGTVRHRGLHPALPHAEKTEKIDALLKEFGKKIPATL
jgi:thiol-disulfide isomerase/thioredoxin